MRVFHLVYTVDIGYLSIARYIVWFFIALAEYNSIMLEIVNDKYEQHEVDYKSKLFISEIN